MIPSNRRGSCRLDGLRFLRGFLPFSARRLARGPDPGGGLVGVCVGTSVGSPGGALIVECEFPRPSQFDREIGEDARAPACGSS
jgi:hypothetical protein